MVKRLFIAVSVLFYSLLGAASAATQSTTQAPSGITISPAFAQIKVDATETEHPFQLKVTNNQQKEQTLSLSSTDFNTLDESGGLAFVGTNPTAIQKKYGLANWIRLPQDSLTIAPKQTVNIDATIVNEPSLAPGGHYGAIMFSLATGNSKASNNSVALHPIASSLLFVTKTGGETYRLKLTNVENNGNIFKLPSSVVLRFYNDGNTHLTPRGIVSVSDPRGNLVSKGVINADSNLILPETYRRYSVPLNKISTPVLPGKYKIKVDFRFDGYDQFRSYQTSQWLLAPMLLVLFLVIVAVALLTGAVLYKNRTRLVLQQQRSKKRPKK